MNAHRELTAFLRAARARTTPESQGIVRGRRRNPGLSADDVAELAGMSGVWYARFESGRARLSLKALGRVADALMLDEVERAQLLALALPELSHSLQFASQPLAAPAPAPGAPSFPSYAAVVRSQYAGVAQDHYDVGPATSIFKVYDRPLGSYLESASGDVTLQTVTNGFGGTAKVDFSLGRFNANIWTGEYVVAPAGVALSYQLEASFDLLVMPLPLERFVRASAPKWDVDRLHAKAWHDPFVFALAQMIWSEVSSDDRDGALFIESTLVAIVARLAALAGRSQRKIPSLTASGLASVVELMSSELPIGRFSLEMLAEIAHMEPHEFVVAFRRATGFTPDHYLSNVRIDKSRSLLARSSLCEAEIALRVGFDDDERYRRLFTARVGCAPSQYRALQIG